MRAIVVHQHGGPEMMRLEDVPDPRPGPGEAVVRIRAAGVNPVDAYIRSGAHARKATPPFTPGFDGAGEIEAVGAGVTAFKPGDRVYVGAPGSKAAGAGTYAERAACVPAQLYPLPSNVTFGQGAALGVPYTTAYRALFQRADARPSETVLVHGATGGVGLAAVDLAKALGARVIATSRSPDKLATLAADYMVDATLPAPGFREAVKEITGGGADVIFDPVGGDVFDESTRCVAFGGRLLVIGFTSGRIASVATNIPLIKGFSVIGVRAGEYGRRFPDKGRENQDAIWALAAEGRIRPRVDRRFALADWRAAFEAMRGSRMIGKIVIEF